MPFKCVVPGCRSNYYHVKGTSSVPMIRYPLEPDMVTAWNEAICRRDFIPSMYSHVCIKHFRDDQMLTAEQRPRPDGSVFPCRRLTRIKPGAVPCVFDIDPSTHRMRPCQRPTYAKRPTATTDTRPRECEILTGCKVEFKPEMWAESEKKKTEETTDEPPAKRGRGRPRKQIQHVVVKSEVLRCCALACTNTSENFIMNTLPQDLNLRNLWVEKIDRLDWAPNDESALCEIHFDEDMWDQDIGSDKVLRPDAVPSLFLHEEAIKSWVTMDNTGNIANIVVDGHSTNDEDSINGGSNNEINEDSMDGSEDDDPSIFVKREALEPEIDMVEGTEEDMVSREASSTEEPFETIYCDSTFNEPEETDDKDYYNNKDEEVDDDSPMIIPTPLEDENPLGDESPLQDGEVSCLDDTVPKRLYGTNSKYLVISPRTKDHNSKEQKVIRRRTSTQLTDEFQCPICDRRLSRRKNLEIHIEKLHPFGEISEYHQKKKKETQNIPQQEETKKTPAFKKPPPPLNPIVPPCLISPSLPTIPVIPLKTPNPLEATSAPLTTSFPIISFSSQSNLVSSSIQTTSSTVLTPTLVGSQPLITSQSLVTPTALIASPSLVAPSNAGSLITSPSIVTTPRPLDPSPTGGEMRKQFLLLLPKQAMIPAPNPALQSGIATIQHPTPAEQTLTAKEDPAIYSVNLNEIPLDKRNKLKEKLKELVDAVVKKNLNPDKIIIAYDRT